MKTALLIKSFRKHFVQLNLLLESIAKFNRDHLPVYLIIPEKDRKRMIGRHLSNLELIFEEDLILNKYVNESTYQDNILYTQLRKWRGVDSFFGRKCYRGTLVQQLCKMALPIYLKGTIDNFVILDSDLVFIREFRETDFVEDTLPELICIPTEWEPGSTLTHWIVEAKRFLGLQTNPESSNWIAHGTCWKSEVIDTLANYIQKYHQRHWQEALMEYPFESKFQDHGFFSEFQLYGVFHKYLSSYQQELVSKPKAYNLWRKIDFERFERMTNKELIDSLRAFHLFGLQKDYISERLRKRTVEKVQKIVNAGSL